MTTTVLASKYADLQRRARCAAK